MQSASTTSFTRNNFTISADPARLDVDAIHRYLSEESYWAKDIPRWIVEKSLNNSLCFGLYDGERLAGFARVITDTATYAYLCDVFILKEYRGRGLGKWLVECVMKYPDLQGLRRWSLLTRDAHSLYAGYGWQPVARPERYMEIADPGIYLRLKEQG